MRVNIYLLLLYFYLFYIDLIPGVNNYNPIKNKTKKFGNPYNDINMISNNPRQNNFMKEAVK